MHKSVLILFITGILSTVHAFDLNERANQLLQPRQSNCIPCPANPPPCPACPSGQECQVISQSCTSCAMSKCIASSTLNNLAGNATPTPVASNTGVIAGGIGGALVLLLIVAGVIFYWRRKKKVQTEEMDAWLSSAGSLDEKSFRSRGSTPTRGNDANSLHHSIAETTMTRASNVIRIGYQPSPLRNTMMSSNTGISNLSAEGQHDSLSTIPSHPPTQFFSADDILRASLATKYRDTQYTDSGTIYSNRDTQYTARNTMYSNRDSVGTIGTTYTRASVATNYRATAIIASAPVPLQVRAQPKIITFGKAQQIPAVPQLTAEKVAEAERSRMTMIAAITAAPSEGRHSLAVPAPPRALTVMSRVSEGGNGPSVPVPARPMTVTSRVSSVAPVASQTSTTAAPRLSTAPSVGRIKSTPHLSTASAIPIQRSITPAPITPTTIVKPRLSRISTFNPLSKQPLSSPFDDVPDDMPESPILGEADSDSFLSASKAATPDSGAAPRHQPAEDIQIIVTPTSSISPSVLRDSMAG